jgi:hypothetical protein
VQAGKGTSNQGRKTGAGKPMYICRGQGGSACTRDTVPPQPPSLKKKFDRQYVFPLASVVLRGPPAGPEVADRHWEFGAKLVDAVASPPHDCWAHT